MYVVWVCKRTCERPCMRTHVNIYTPVRVCMGTSERQRKILAVRRMRVPRAKNN